MLAVRIVNLGALYLVGGDKVMGFLEISIFIANIIVSHFHELLLVGLTG